VESNLSFDAALDRVIGYLADEGEDYECSSAARRAGHIWNAVRVLIQHRAERQGDD
jgi:hypothetical protein